MKLLLNQTCIIHSNIVSDIKIAKETGYDGMEFIYYKLNRFLNAGFTVADLKKYLDGFPVYAVGHVEDIERRGEGFKEVCKTTEFLCGIANELGCRNVQLVTGPLAMGTAGNPMYPGVFVSDEYKDLLKKEWKEIRKITAENLKIICDIGAGYNVRFYLETLGWTPAASLGRGLELLEETGKDNIGLIIDFWHMYVTDTTPDQIAKLNKSIINGVHYCDSLKKTGGVIDQTLRNVFPGFGCAPIKEYMEAIKATGYDDWMSGECFSEKNNQLESYDAALMMRKCMEYALY